MRFIIIEVRQLFELEVFAPCESVERFRDTGVGEKNGPN